MLTRRSATVGALGLLGSIEFAQQATLVPEFDRLFKTMTSLQKEFWEAMAKPKADRRPTLAKEYMEATAAMLATLDKLRTLLGLIVLPLMIFHQLQLIVCSVLASRLQAKAEAAQPPRAAGSGQSQQSSAPAHRPD